MASQAKGRSGGDVPDTPYLGLVRDAAFRPVFIMGSARSGTTILYRLLSMTERFNCVTAYHLVKYDELLANHETGRTAAAKEEVSALFARLGITGARFDGVEVSPDFPEEYGFGLTDGSRLQLAPHTLPRFLELCGKVQHVSDPRRPLLLKNPWDSCSFLYIKRVLPQSRFIFIHRNPADVVPSMLDGMRRLLRERNPYHALVARFYDRLMEQPLRLRLARAVFSPRFGLGSRVVRWQVSRTARYFVDHVGALPLEDHVSVRYEDLCRDPETVVNRILKFLGQAENPAVRYREMIRVRARPRGERGDVERESILKQGGLQPYLAFCGYETE
jgi:sulfotransferase family protein